MEIVKERAGGVVHLRLAGRLDNHWSQSLDETLHEVAREGARHVRLDFSGVTYLSSAAAAVLMKHHREATALQGAHKRREDEGHQQGQHDHQQQVRKAGQDQPRHRGHGRPGQHGQQRAQRAADAQLHGGLW